MAEYVISKITTPSGDICKLKDSNLEPIIKSVDFSETVIVNDAAAIPAKDITIAIEPVQSGSGDPSPTNVRPISGWTGANVTRTGKNLLDSSNVGIGTGSMYNKSVGTVLTTGGSKATATGTNPVTIVNTQNWIGAVFFSEPLKSGQTYALRHRIGGTDNTNIKRSLYFVDSENTIIEKIGNFTNVDQDINYVYSLTVTPDTDGLRLAFCVEGATQQTITVYDLGLNYPASDISYEVYSAQSYPISWQSEAGTVYGGTLDVTTGLLTVTYGNIASYNGESLPGKWISSMDVYSAGGTPTTGAQLVYELATPQTYQLTPTEVKLLLGENNVWADTGETRLTYGINDYLGINNEIQDQCSKYIKIENIANNLTTTIQNKVLDARQGKALKDLIDGITPASIGAKTLQIAVTDPTASGTSITFIDTISQNTQGVILPTKKTVSTVSQSAAGLMSASDKIKLDGIATGAQVNSITGVKGDAENSYRTENVNLTPANIGAPSTTGSGASGTWGIDISGNAATASTLVTAGRQTSANTIYGDGKIRVYLSTDSMTSGKPPIDGIILHGAWDWESYNGQLCIGNNSDAYLYVRGSNGSTWGNWHKVFTDVAAIPVYNGGTGATSAPSARNNLGVFSGSSVVNFSNGAGTIAFSTVGVSSKPTVFVATASNQSCIMRYDYDQTNVTQGPIKLYCIQANGSGYSGAVRFSWICIP